MYIYMYVYIYIYIYISIYIYVYIIYLYIYVYIYIYIYIDIYIYIYIHIYVYISLYAIMSRHVDVQCMFLQIRENKSHKHSFVFRSVFNDIGPYSEIPRGGGTSYPRVRGTSGYPPTSNTQRGGVARPKRAWKYVGM